MPKTIFGTTEKSNFILNMNYTTVRRWVLGILCACIIVPLIGGMFITGIEGTSSFLGSFLYATGFSCILFYIVLLLRKDISFKQYPAAFLVVGLAVLTFASYYRVALAEPAQENINTALLGELGRYEGLLALFAYFGIFLLATAVMKYSSVKIIFDILVGAGIVQAIVAVMQHIPWDFPSDFRKLPALLLLKDVHLSSGLSDSPIFYGSFLTIVSAVAIAGAIYDKNITRARVYGVSSVLFFLTGLFTSSVIPLIGIGTTLVVTLVLELTAGNGGTKFDSGILKSSGKRLAALIAAFAVVFGIVFAAQGIYLRDKAIAYTDAFNRLFITAGSPSFVNEQSLWEIGAERSVTMIKEHPILGVGPDMFAKNQFSGSLVVDSIDRSYNEYLYIAATRGIPSLLMYLVLLGATIIRLVKDLKQFASDREKWFRPALLTAVIAYSVQAFFSVSAVTVAPFFWLLLGISWSKFIDENRDKSTK
ncbi:MAG: O-antigen ligase family protein [Oscillospiraceae bacterium]|nr:O-antigen ligase family protein [Oscillospiraceae bacterium]